MHPVPQIAKSRFQWPKRPIFVENVTILPGTDDPAEVLPGTANTDKL